MRCCLTHRMTYDINFLFMHIIERHRGERPVYVKSLSPVTIPVGAGRSLGLPEGIPGAWIVGLVSFDREVDRLAEVRRVEP